MRNTILAAVGKGHRKLMILLITDKMFQYFKYNLLARSFLNEKRIVSKLPQRNTTQVLLKNEKKNVDK